METSHIKEKIKLALEAVKDEKDPTYKLEAFKIILRSLLETENPPKISDDSTKDSQQEDKSVSDPTNLLFNLAKKCTISLPELKNIFEYENDKLILLKKIDAPSVTEKLIIACQIVITAWMKGKNVEWVKGSVLRELVEKNSLGDTTNMAKILNKSELIRKKGSKKGTVYSLTTDGWQKGLKLITKLGKGN